MDKQDNVFFEIVLRNSRAIIKEAHCMKENQNRMLHFHHSNDRTADAAIDNIFGGQMTIDSNGELRRLRNVQAWASIIERAMTKYRSSKDQLFFNVFQHAYLEARTTRDALRLLKVSRERYFKTKEEIKNYIRAGACEMGIWKVLR